MFHWKSELFKFTIIIVIIISSSSSSSSIGGGGSSSSSSSKVVVAATTVVVVEVAAVANPMSQYNFYNKITQSYTECRKHIYIMYQLFIYIYIFIYLFSYFYCAKIFMTYLLEAGKDKTNIAHKRKLIVGQMSFCSY